MRLTVVHYIIFRILLGLQDILVFFGIRGIVGHRIVAGVLTFDTIFTSTVEKLRFSVLGEVLMIHFLDPVKCNINPTSVEINVNDTGTKGKVWFH